MSGEEISCKKNARGLTVLHFLLQDIRLCVALHCIEKILPLPLLETVPTSPLYLTGLMNFQNKSVPIIDLAIRIGLARNQTYPLTIPILLCSDGTQKVGLIVDEIIGLGEIEEESIQMQDSFEQNNSPFVGAVTLETGVSLLMNKSWVVSFDMGEEKNELYIDHHLLKKAKDPNHE